MPIAMPNPNSGKMVSFEVFSSQGVYTTVVTRPGIETSEGVLEEAVGGW